MNKKPWAMARKCADFRPIQIDYDQVIGVDPKAAPSAIKRR